MNARVLKFHVQISHEKIVDPHFFLCPNYAPFWNYVPLKTKFENLVCKLSQEVFELQPSYLAYWLGPRSRRHDQLLRTFCQSLTKTWNFEILIDFSTFL